MAKTHIKFTVPCSRGYEERDLKHTKSIIEDKENVIEFSYASCLVGESNMELLYLNDSDSLLPIIIFNCYSTDYSKAKLQELLGIYASNINKNKTFIGENRQFFLVSTVENDNFVEVNFLNNGKYTEEEVNNIKIELEDLANNIKEDHKKYIIKTFLDEVVNFDNDCVLTTKREKIEEVYIDWFQFTNNDNSIESDWFKVDTGCTLDEYDEIMEKEYNKFKNIND